MIIIPSHYRHEAFKCVSIVLLGALGRRWQAFRTVEGVDKCRTAFPSCKQTGELATNSTSKTAGFQICQLLDIDRYICLKVSIAYFALCVLENA